MNLCRNATLEELEHILGWASDEGWNPGLGDPEAFYKADPNGFFVAVDRENQPIASVSVVNHTADFAFLGLYIVKPEHRGQGVGHALWTHALAHAGDRTIGLDGVEAQQDNYRVSGFVHAGGTTRFAGKVTGQRQDDVRPATPDDIQRLVLMEGQLSGVVKPDYLTAWFSRTGTRLTLVLEDDGQIAGCVTVRACRSGAKIGPLIANDSSAAQKLLSHAGTVFDGPYMIDVPETAIGLTHLCQRLGFEPGFRTARMYRGKAPSSRPDVFAVTSLELG